MALPDAELLPDLEVPSPEGAPSPKAGFLPSRTALLIVDMQIDFVGAEGAVKIPGAFRIVDKCKGWAKLAHFSKWPVICTMDWHPANHVSFIPNGGSHPIHCIQGWRGAQLHAGLNITPAHVYFARKGVAYDADPRSAFEASVERGDKTVLPENISSPSQVLAAHKVKNIFITGVAVEYTIRSTVEQAVQLGYNVLIPSDAVAGMHPEGVAKTFDEFRSWGVAVL